MQGVARLAAEDRRHLFTESAARAGLPALMIEKDFWVCWTLSRLYSVDGMPRLLFKGGTSLSKCFGLIERFSEDIDLGLHRDDIGLNAADCPSSDKGSSRQKRARKHLRETASAYITGTFEPLLRADFEAHLGNEFRLESIQVSSEVVVLFEYPTALGRGAYGEAGYVRPAVRLELGARSDHFPTRRVEISPEAANHFPDQFLVPNCAVIAQAPERTLLEKALILHSAIASGLQHGQSSRHAYDLAALLRGGVAKDLTRTLFEEVAVHKRVFSDDKHAGDAPQTGIRMVPEGALRRDLESDYARMSEMFYGTPPSFEELVSALGELETTINRLATR